MSQHDFAAGAMVLVAARELIPESRAEGGDAYFSTMALMAGFALMMVPDVAFG